MSKLPEDHKFLDLSDYGRPIARLIANALKSTAVTPIHVTFGFLISGVIAIWCMYYGYYWYAALFFILKSILDAADGELARLKDTPSYTGRYFDSVSDIVLNILIFLVLWRITNTDFALTLLAFLGLQLQGTLYNYYYVILRNKFHGDVTSRIFESGTPVAMVGEHQRNVNILFWWYKILYGSFDLIIYKLDAEAANGRRLPNWLMTAVSTFGLGFQLLIISVMLVLGWVNYIIPFFIIYSIFIFLFIAIRRSL
ncbi:CDP-alcohol phosphatidyltransferase family protein [Arenibacter sp. BSSL-BM3]|uniref:CDP-alcohol phosphatidyltransferase family protein n=1 Tax=Arenibacter arenosicollis TaxID=2762274 RepID=A0ABR7QPT0_9FLAO|nr:CDP-alcohol phosphatidyltransferase family protein [Arenibacter arenosicollis]MBC8769207.1 CDP-alcohol phosphatidyltransferase family protein [Arenibacter arenosicollis]